MSFKISLTSLARSYSKFHKEVTEHSCNVTFTGRSLLQPVQRSAHGTQLRSLLHTGVHIPEERVLSVCTYATNLERLNRLSETCCGYAAQGGGHRSYFLMSYNPKRTDAHRRQVGRWASAITFITTHDHFRWRHDMFAIVTLYTFIFIMVTADVIFTLVVMRRWIPWLRRKPKKPDVTTLEQITWLERCNLQSNSHVICLVLRELYAHRRASRKLMRHRGESLPRHTSSAVLGLLQFTGTVWMATDGEQQDLWLKTPQTDWTHS
jgi:hypothetical protein